MPSLNELNPVLLKDLSSAFEFVPTEKAKPVRYRRCEKRKMASSAETLSSNTDDQNENQNSDYPIPDKSADDDKLELKVDSFDLADPVCVLDKLPKTFYTDIVYIY
jgi:hypothetical protein